MRRLTETLVLSEKWVPLDRGAMTSAEIDIAASYEHVCEVIVRIVLLSVLCVACGSNAPSGYRGADAHASYRGAVAALREGEPRFAHPLEVPGHRVFHPAGLGSLLRTLNAACWDGNSRACGEATWWYWFGPPILQSGAAGDQTLLEGVRGNDALSLYLRATRQNLAGDAGLLVRACSQGLGAACTHHAMFLAGDQEAEGLAEQGCNLGDAFGCGLYAFLRLRAPAGIDGGERVRLRALAETGCQGGDFISCLSVWVLQGRPGLPNWSLLGATTDAPRGRVPLYFNGPSLRHRIPSTGHLLFRRETEREAPLTVLRLRLAFSHDNTVEVTHYVRSRTHAARLVIRTRRPLQRSCHIGVKGDGAALRFRTRHRHNVADTRISLDDLWRMAKHDGGVLVCNEAYGGRGFQRYIGMIAFARRHLFDPNGDFEDWGPG